MIYKTAAGEIYNERTIQSTKTRPRQRNRVDNSTSGIVNLFWGFALSGTALVSIIGIICVPLAILPSVLGVFEIIYAAKLFSNPPQAVKPSTNIAVLEIANILALNLFSMVVGILSLVFYNDTLVKDYFLRLNGTLPPRASARS